MTVGSLIWYLLWQKWRLRVVMVDDEAGLVYDLDAVQEKGYGRERVVTLR